MIWKQIAAVLMGLIVSFTVGSVMFFESTGGGARIAVGVVVLTAIGGLTIAGLNYVYEAGKRMCTYLFDWFY